MSFFVIVFFIAIVCTNGINNIEKEEEEETANCLFGKQTHSNGEVYFYTFVSLSEINELDTGWVESQVTIRVMDWIGLGSILTIVAKEILSFFAVKCNIILFYFVMLQFDQKKSTFFLPLQLPP